MEEWADLIRGKAFITDLGQDHTVTLEDSEQLLGRYAVWSPLKGQEGHTIIEVSSDLTTLMSRYSIPPELVCTAQTAP